MSPTSVPSPAPVCRRTGCWRWRRRPSTPASTPSPAPSSRPPANAASPSPRQPASPPPPVGCHRHHRRPHHRRSAPRPASSLPAARTSAARYRRSKTKAGTAVLVRRDGTPVGVLGIADRLRPDATADSGRAHRLTGQAPVLLTGDNERAARHLAAEVGITDVRAGLLPQDKVAAVKQWEARACVLVVGDGVNDAPALAAAHTGIAMGRAGSDLALETADAVVVRDELAAIPAVVALSRQRPPPRRTEPGHRRDLHHRPGRLGPDRPPSRCRSASPATKAPPSSSDSTACACCATPPGTAQRRKDEGLAPDQPQVREVMGQVGLPRGP